jgi:hypothetical protein
MQVAGAIPNGIFFLRYYVTTWTPPLGHRPPVKNFPNVRKPTEDKALFSPR